MDNQLAIVSLTPEQQRGWVQVGQWKFDLAERHKLKTLKLQELLLKPGATIVEIEATLAEYRKLHSEMVKDGQKFRTYVTDKVLQQSLDIEAEYSHKKNESYLFVEKDLISKKQKDEADKKATQAKRQEELNYVAHVKNQYALLETDLRTRCLNEINTMYVNYLKTAVKTPDTKAIKDTLVTLSWAKPLPFTPQYLTREEMTALKATITNPPSMKAIMQEMCDQVDEKFKSYAHDLAANTVEQVEAEFIQELQDIQTETNIEIGINSMQAQASVPQIVTEGKALKRSVEVVIEGTETWAVHVIAAFLKFPLCRSHVAVKAWENLSVKQMAQALGRYASETGDQAEGLVYRETVK